MQIIKDIEQGTDEWLRLRMGVATASNFSKIVTSKGESSTSHRKYALELTSQMLVSELEELYKNDTMQRGNDLEPEARSAYEEYNFISVEEVGFISCGDYGYSPDGLVGDDGLIEIKCPLAVTHTKYLFEDKLPTEYVQQVQGGLFVSGRKWCDFISYHDNFKDDNKLFIKRVFRDEEFIGKLQEGIHKVIALRDEYLKKLTHE